MTAALEAHGVGKRHRRRWALRDCTFSVPEQSIVGLTGPNSAGKSTLLALAAGLQQPTEGTLRVAGEGPTHTGYVAPGAPLYRNLTAAGMLASAPSLNTTRGDRERAPRPPATPA